MPRPPKLLLLLAACALASACTSLKFTRDTETSGRFRATGWSFTILSIDLPKHALDTARENVADARRPNMVVEETTVIPHFGPFWDFLNDIIGIRYARITGRYGFEPDEETAARAR